MAGEKEIQDDKLEKTETEPLKEVDAEDANEDGLDDKDSLEPLQELEDADAGENLEEADFNASDLPSALDQNEIDKAIAALQQEAGEVESDSNEQIDEPADASTAADADDNMDYEPEDEEAASEDDDISSEEDEVSSEDDEIPSEDGVVSSEDEVTAAEAEEASEASDSDGVDEPIDLESEDIEGGVQSDDEEETIDEAESEEPAADDGPEAPNMEELSDLTDGDVDDNEFVGLEDEDPLSGSDTDSADIEVEATDAGSEDEENADVSDTVSEDESTDLETDVADTETETVEEAEIDGPADADETQALSGDDASDASANENDDTDEFAGLDDDDEPEGPEDPEADLETDVTEPEANSKVAELDIEEEKETPEGEAKVAKKETNPEKNAEKPVKKTGEKQKQKKKKPVKKAVPASKKKVGSPKSQKGSKDGPKKAAGFYRVLKIAALIAGLAAFVLYSHPSLLKLGKQPPKPAVQQLEAPVAQVPTQAREKEPTRPIDGPRTRLAEAKQLRQELLVKKEEIKQLDEHYRSGIIDLKIDILEEMKRHRIASFSKAKNNKKIELALRTIQRRQAYTQLLEKPVEWIDNGSEELLYLSRKAIFDLQIMPVASGVDMDRHMRHLNAVIQKYQLGADKLTIDVKNADLEPIETIWERIHTHKEQIYADREHAHNKGIWDEICAGDLGRIGDMTHLSAEAAACLSEIKGTDLFLNGIDNLSIGAAENLVLWQGNWICLNGFKTLSPAIAKHLFQWQGNWLSLNGLSEFPPELAKMLSGWKGEQLELMGLNYSEKQSKRIGLKYLAQWEKAGGKLFVPQTVRKEIEKMM